MATNPVKLTQGKQNGFESFLSAAARDIEKVLNVGINIATAEQPLINQLLPPQFATAENAATALIKNVMLTTEAKYQALGATVSYPQKVAEVVAITGTALIQILAGIGVTAGQTELTALVTGATSFSVLPTAGLTTLNTASTIPAN
jgi:ribosomal protein L24